MVSSSERPSTSFETGCLIGLKQKNQASVAGQQTSGTASPVLKLQVHASTPSTELASEDQSQTLVVCSLLIFSHLF